MSRIAAALLLLLGCGGHLSAKMEAEYRAEETPQNPSSFGWNEILGDGAVVGPEAGGQSWGPAWKIGSESSNVNRAFYRKALAKENFQFQPWVAEATLVVEAASGEKLRDVFFEVQDGVSEWVLMFVKDAQQEGIGFLDQDSKWQQVFTGDIGTQFIRVEMEYLPGDDEVVVRVNGLAAEKKINRSEVPPVRVKGRYHIAWGDGAAAAHPVGSRSQSYWQSVKFETKP